MGAILFRTLFITLGSVLMPYEWIVVIFGILLILAGFTILSLPEKPFDPSCNPIILGVKNFFPSLPLFMGISSESRSMEKT